MKSKILLFLTIFIVIVTNCRQFVQIPVEPTQSLTPTTDKQIIPSPTSQENLIVFVGRYEQASSIGLMTDEGQNIRYLTDAAGNESHPKWSPDGQSIAYLSDQQIPLDEHNQQFYDLWLLTLSDEPPIRLTQKSQVSSYLTTFVWSPDSNKIMYNASPIGVNVIDLTRLSTDSVGRHFNPPFAWSVKNELALSDSYIYPQAVFSLAILEADYKPVLPPQDNFVAGGHYSLNTATSLEWHPAGELLAIGSYFALRGEGDLRIVSRVEDGIVVQASLAERFDFIEQKEVTDVAWSPDGRMLAFRFINIKEADQPDDDIEQIYVANSELTTLTALTPENMLCHYPQWSPDSTRLVFDCQERGEENSDIWMVNRDGSGLHQVTDTAYYEGEASWQPRQSE